VWSYSNGVLTRIPKSDEEIEQELQNIAAQNTPKINPTTTESIAVISNPNNQADAAAIFNNLVTIAVTSPSTLVEAVDRLQSVIAEASESTFVAVQSAIQTISNRISSVSLPSFQLASRGGVGVAAGDSMESKYGFWFSPSYMTAVKKAKGSSPGYKSKAFGTTLGFDTLINEDKTVGIAFSYSNNIMNHTDSNAGDKSKTKSFSFAVYGMQELNDQWFLQGVALVGKNRVHNKEIRIIPNGSEIAEAKYTSTSYGLESLIGYNKKIKDNVMLTLMTGLEFNRLSKTKYKESGTTNQNLLIRKKADDKLDAVIGARVAYNTIVNDINFIPEMHGFIRYDLINKNVGVAVELEGLVNLPS
jgi:outer membrane autotransporter protein